MSSKEKHSVREWAWVGFASVAAIAGYFVLLRGRSVETKASATSVRLPVASLLEVSRPLTRVAQPSAVVIEFMDYECPPCKFQASEIAGLQSDTVEVRIANFPLKMHPHAWSLALATLDSSGDFEETHARMMKLDKEGIAQTAREWDSHKAAFDKSALKNYESRLRQSIAVGNQYSVAGTPTIFVYFPKTNRLVKMGYLGSLAAFISSGGA